MMGGGMMGGGPMGGGPMGGQMMGGGQMGNPQMGGQMGGGMCGGNNMMGGMCGGGMGGSMGPGGPMGGMGCGGMGAGGDPSMMMMQQGGMGGGGAWGGAGDVINVEIPDGPPVNFLIGQGGQNVKQYEGATGTRIQVNKQPIDGLAPGRRMVTIQGGASMEARQNAEAMEYMAERITYLTQDPIFSTSRVVLNSFANV